MKTYEVRVWEEQGGTMFVEARTKERARKIAYEHINCYGFELPKNKSIAIKGLKTTHRSVELL